MTVNTEQLRASAAETRAKVAIVQSDPMIFPPILEEMLRSADSVDAAADALDQSAAEIERLREVQAKFVEEIISTLERRWKTCMERGDQRGDDMAHGVNGDIEHIKRIAARDSLPETPKT